MTKIGLPSFYENRKSKNRIEALKRLASVGFVGQEGNHKTLLLKIMSRPLMEHRHDYFNDAVRVCALTIDIRYEIIIMPNSES